MVSYFLKYVKIYFVICTMFISTSTVYAQDNQVFVGESANPNTVELWKKQIGNVGIAGKTWIGPYTEDSKTTSGHRDTIVFVPSQYDSSKTTDILVWLHGHHGFNKFDTRVLPHIMARYARGDNPIVIAIEQPWTHNGSTPTSRNGTGPFRKAGEFEDWAAGIFPVLTFLGIPVEKLSGKNVTIYGHSAGGSGILSLARSGALAIIEPKRIIFSDSTYGSWFTSFYDSFYKNYPETEVVVLVRRDGPTHSSMRSFFRDRKNPPATLKYLVLDRREWTHKRIGDNCLLYPDVPFPPN